MASFGGPLASRDHTTTGPLRLSPSPSRWTTLVAVVILASVSFLVGFRLGGDGESRPIVAPSDGSLRPRLATPAPPPVQPDAVSDELASAAGGVVSQDGWAVCVVDSGPSVCQSIRPAAEPLDAFDGTALPLSSPSASLAALWQVVPTSVVVGTHVVLVASLSLQMQPALLARVDGREGSRKATPVEPGREGITYFDFGALHPGQYLIAVVDQASSPPAANVAIPAQVAGLLVCARGPGSAGPGCSSAP